MRLSSLGIAALCVGLFASPVWAAALDFNETTVNTHVGGNTLTLSNAVITTDGDDLFVGGPSSFGAAFGPNLGFCGVTQAAGGDCSTVTDIVFSTLIADLIFRTAVGAGGDQATASIYDASDALIASTTFTANTLISFVGHSGVARLRLDASASLPSGDLGFAYGDFTFETEGADVPVPAAAPLLLGGLGAFALLRRRRG